MSDKCELKREGILAAGNWIVDHIKVVDTYPDQDALSFIYEHSKSNGGGPYNLLKDLVNLGAGFPLKAAGLVGDDNDGQWIINDCLDYGIDTSGFIQTKNASTSYTDAMTVKSTGRRTFFHHEGANALLSEKDVNLSNIKAKYFYLGYLLLLKSLDEIRENGQTGAKALLAKASSEGYYTVVDLVSAQLGDYKNVVIPSLSEIDALFLNEFEASALLSFEVKENDVQSLTKAARFVLDQGVRDYVILHSSFGAVAVSSAGETAVQGSVKLPENFIKGAAGAGDAFAAGFILGMNDSESLKSCLHLGVCSAASCLSDPTTSGGVMRMEQCLDMGSKYGFRPFE